MDSENRQGQCVLPQPPAEAHYTVYMLKDPEGKIYIGCTGKPVEKRWQNGHNYNHDQLFFKAIVVIGWENFEKKILCEKLTREGAQKLEKWFIAYYDSANPEKGYNRALGGFGKGVRMSEASKKISSEALLRKYNEDPAYRKRIGQGVYAAYVNNPGYRERVSEGLLKAYKNDPGYRERVSEGVLKAYENDPSIRVRVSEGVLKAYENDPAIAARMSDSMKAYYQQNPERKEEIRLRMKEYHSHPEHRAFADCDSRPKPVVCVETGVVYSSGREAERATGYHGIHRVCRGLQVTSGGYHWKYA